MFLEACRDLEIAYRVILPFSEDRFRRDFSGKEAWSRVQTLIDGACHLERIPEGADACSGYHRAAMKILEEADLMLFVWDGKPERGLGGTGETVREARAKGVPLQIIDARTATLSPFENIHVLPRLVAMMAAG